MSDPTDAVVDRLEIERLRGSRDETPADPLGDLIATLARLLANPGPPDHKIPEEQR
ncbi:hypothetical protein [Nonomuraea typhae]|uniref:hypothetical protein n=1 Tax=Nonomuraea typhae TaxID=2603600 RepID=UPI0012F84FB7|nr:hypothetical protein [Nonomuraea typhae]